MCAIVKRDFSRETPALVTTLSGVSKPIALDENGSAYTVEYMIRRAVEEGFVPRFLYKYRAPDHKTAVAPNRFTENIFTDHTLWFGSPENFNDPFDCRITMESDNSYEEILQFLLMKTPELYTEKDEQTKLKIRQEKVILAHEMYRDKQRWQAHMDSIMQNQFNSGGICSFSEKHDNPLMWSHYGNSHTGLCLKYDVSADPYFFVLLEKMLYSEIYPRYNLCSSFLKLVLSQGNDDDFTKFLTTKSLDWSYEKEWRVYRDENESGAFPFKKESLVEVLFGCKACDKFIDRIRNLAIESGLAHLTYKKARVSKTEFLLEFDELL